MASPRLGAAVAAAGLFGCCAVMAVHVVEGHVDTSAGGRGAGAAVVEVCAVALLAGVGAAQIVGERGTRIVGVMLLVSALATTLAIPPPEAIRAAPWFTAAVAIAPSTGLMAVCAALLWPSPAQRTARMVAGVAVVPFLLSGPIPTLVLQPRRAGCNTCAANWIGIASAPDLRETLLRAGLLATALWAAAATLVIAIRLIRLPRTARPIVGPVLLAGAGVAVLCGVSVLHVFALPVVEIDGKYQALWRVQCVLAGAMCIGIAASSIAYRRSARRLTRRVLTANPGAELLRQSFAEIVGDPALALVLNPSGEHAREGTLRVEREGTTLAEVRFNPRFVAAVPRLSAAVRAAALAVEYAAALQALKAEEEALLESRRRVVRTGDAVRHAIERDLHDGAQQRLVALSLAAVTAQRRASNHGEVTALQTVRHEVSLALAELRTIAHGLFPAALHDDGLRAALIEFQNRSPVPLTIDADHAIDAIPQEAAMAAYRLVTDTVDAVLASPAQAHLILGCDADRLDVVLTVRGTFRGDGDSFLLHTTDRFHALAGDVAMTGGPDDWTVRGWVPCGS